MTPEELFEAELKAAVERAFKRFVPPALIIAKFSR